MPPLDPVRLIERLHGHLGWLAAAALVHPAILLGGRPRRAHLAVGLATAFVTLVGALGAGLYPAYRERLREPIFEAAPAVGYLFERKEHLAFGAVVFAWAGALAYVASLHQGIESEQGSLRKAARWAFVAATALTLTTALLGTLVASFRSF